MRRHCIDIQGSVPVGSATTDETIRIASGVIDLKTSAPTNGLMPDYLSYKAVPTRGNDSPRLRSLIDVCEINRFVNPKRIQP